jgi:thiamine pyrophosphokinase
MTIVDYLNDFTHSKLNVIGPLANQKLVNSLNQNEIPNVFVDGGTKWKGDHSGFTIGDGDSYPFKLDQKLNEDKDFSDLKFVLDHIPSHYKQLNLIGFLGGRKDHEISNLFEVHNFLSTREKTVVYFDNQIIAKSQGYWETEILGAFSVFCFSKNNLKINGDCKFSTSKHLRPLSSHGISNLGNGKVNITSDSPFFIILIS